MRRSERGVSSRPHIALRDLSIAWLIPLWLAMSYLVFGAVRHMVDTHTFARDIHAYWLTAHQASLYGLGPGIEDAYLYSPAFATAIWPLANLSWPVFLTIWLIGQAAASAWLLAPLGRWAVPAFLIVVPTMAQGNIYGLMAISLIIGMRYQAAWALPILTKITPGVVLLWFVVRREWRSLGIALLSTAVIAAISFVLTPSAWFQWLEFLTHHGAESGFTRYLRIIAAGVVAVVAARRDIPWLLAVAMFLSCPVVTGINNWILLAAIPRLVGMRRPDALEVTHHAEEDERAAKLSRDGGASPATSGTNP